MIKLAFLMIILLPIMYGMIFLPFIGFEHDSRLVLVSYTYLKMIECLFNFRNFAIDFQ